MPYIGIGRHGLRFNFGGEIHGFRKVEGFLGDQGGLLVRILLDKRMRVASCH